MAVKPVKEPAFDAKAANDAFVASLRKGFGHVVLPTGEKLPVVNDSSRYDVFETGSFVDYYQWIGGIAEFDGKGLNDAVKTNAQDLNDHKNADNLRHSNIADKLTDHEARLARLETATGPLGSRFG